MSAHAARPAVGHVRHRLRPDSAESRRCSPSKCTVARRLQRIFSRCSTCRSCSAAVLGARLTMQAHADVVVIARELNDKVFGGANSVGKTFEPGRSRVSGRRRARTAGNPLPKFYDLNNNKYGKTEQAFMPFTRAIDQQMPSLGQQQLRRRSVARAGLGGPICSPNASGCSSGRSCRPPPMPQRYRVFLNNYAAEQQRIGPLPLVGAHADAQCARVAGASNVQFPMKCASWCWCPSASCWSACSTPWA